MQAQEVRTEVIGAEVLKAMVPEIVGLLLSWGRRQINVAYGMGCHLTMENLWAPISINTTELGSFIDRSVQNGVFAFGRCNLHIEDQQESLEFVICHESDAHFESIDEDLVMQVSNHWISEGMTIYASTGEKGSAKPKHWRRIDPEGIAHSQ